MSGAAPGPAFVALIPARLASTRLPEKALADIGGAPMVVRVAQQAAAAGARRVAVATDAQPIAKVVREAGFEAVMTAPDHPSGTDRLAEAASILKLDPEQIVVNVQGDEPLIDPALISAVAQRLAVTPAAAIATAAHRIDALADYLNPNVVKVVADANSMATMFSRAPVPFDRDHLAGFPARIPAELSAALRSRGLPLRHIGIYAYRASFLAQYPQLERAPTEELESLEQLRALWHGYGIALLITAAAPAAGVDTAEDLARVRALFAARSRE